MRKKGDEYEKIFEPALNKLRDLLSNKMFDEFEEIFIECAVECNKFYAVEGMKLAIGIMDGSYVPLL